MSVKQLHLYLTVWSRRHGAFIAAAPARTTVAVLFACIKIHIETQLKGAFCLCREKKIADMYTVYGEIHKESLSLKVKVQV